QSHLHSSLVEASHATSSIVYFAPPKPGLDPHANWHRSKTRCTDRFQYFGLPRSGQSSATCGLSRSQAHHPDARLLRMSDALQHAPEWVGESDARVAIHGGEGVRDHHLQHRSKRTAKTGGGKKTALRARLWKNSNCSRLAFPDGWIGVDSKTDRRDRVQIFVRHVHQAMGSHNRQRDSDSLGGRFTVLLWSRI